MLLCLMDVGSLVRSPRLLVRRFRPERNCPHTCSPQLHSNHRFSSQFAVHPLGIPLPGFRPPSSPATSLLSARYSQANKPFLFCSIQKPWGGGGHEIQTPI